MPSSKTKPLPSKKTVTPPKASAAAGLAPKPARAVSAKATASIPSSAMPVLETRGPKPIAVQRVALPTQRLWALLWFAAPAFVASHGMWWCLRRLLEPHQTAWPAWVVIWFIAGAVVAFALVAGTASLVPIIESRRLVYPVVALLVTAPILWLMPLSVAVPLAWVSIAVGLWAGAEAIHRESTSRSKIDVRSTLAHVMAWIVLGASLSVALLQYDISRTTISATREVQIVTGRVVSVLETFAPRFVPHFQADMTVDEVLGDQIPTADSLLKSFVTTTQLDVSERNALGSKLNDLGVSNVTLPPNGSSVEVVRQALDSALARSRQEIVAELRSNFSRQLNFTLRGDETVHQALTDLVLLRIGSRAAGFVRFLPPILSLSLFLVLRILSPLLEMAAVAVGWLWYRALRLAHVIHITSVPAVVEQLEWRT